jgi:hypothetical protein
MAEEVLRELNIARQQPQVYIEHLKARRKLMVRKIRQKLTRILKSTLN